MSSSNEFSRTDDNSIQIDHKIEEHLYDVQEIIAESNSSHERFKPLGNNDDSNQIYQPIFYSSPCNLISDSGDVIDGPNDNYEKLQSSMKPKISIDCLSKRDHSEDDSLVEPYPTPDDSISINEHQYLNSDHYVHDNEEKNQNTTTQFQHHVKTQYSFITEHPLTHVDSQHAILMERELEVIQITEKEVEMSQSINFDNEIQIIEKIDNQENFILPEKIDFKDLNPYEPSIPQLLIHNELNIDTSLQYVDEDNQNSTNSLSMCYLSCVNIEYCTTSMCLLLPQLIQNQIESSNSFQQLRSAQLYSTKSIEDSNTSENILSILWSLIILLSKLIIAGFYFLYSCAKFLRYDTLLFSFCYLLGALFAMNAYFLIDFFLIMTCIISIFVASYEKWLFHDVGLTEYIDNDDGLNNIESENQYWKRIKLAAYGLAIGTISTYII